MPSAGARWTVNGRRRTVPHHLYHLHRNERAGLGDVEAQPPRKVVRRKTTGRVEEEWRDRRWPRVARGRTRAAAVARRPLLSIPPAPPPEAEAEAAAAVAVSLDQDRTRGLGMREIITSSLFFVATRYYYFTIHVRTFFPLTICILRSFSLSKSI